MRPIVPPFILSVAMLAGLSLDVHAAKPSSPARGRPAASGSASAVAPPEAPAATDVLLSLKKGNAAFVKGTTRHPHQDGARVREVAAGQKPMATVLSCSDSRVPVELLFDQGIGDVFTVRVAGNVADTDELGTIEYGVDHLGTPVLVVMGHTKCGAVTAVTTGAEVHGHIPELVDNITPAVATAKDKNPTLEGKALVEPAIIENVFQAMGDVITKSELVRKRLKEGKVKIVGALYHLEDGSVEWLGEHPKEKDLIAKGDATPPTPHGTHAATEHAPEKGDKGEKAEAHGEPGQHEGAAEGEHGDAENDHAKAPKPAPINPIAFAIVAAVACIAGAVSMKLSSRS